MTIPDWLVKDAQELRQAHEAAAQASAPPLPNVGDVVGLGAQTAYGFRFVRLNEDKGVDALGYDDRQYVLGEFDKRLTLSFDSTEHAVQWLQELEAVPAVHGSLLVQSPSRALHPVSLPIERAQDLEERATMHRVMAETLAEAQQPPARDSGGIGR